MPKDCHRNWYFLLQTQVMENFASDLCHDIYELHHIVYIISPQFQTIIQNPANSGNSDFSDENSDFSDISNILPTIPIFLIIPIFPIIQTFFIIPIFLIIRIFPIFPVILMRNRKNRNYDQKNRRNRNSHGAEFPKVFKNPLYAISTADFP